ncbi:hypothetical protein E2C01_003061 [Portunus trituberculatus]|uniref:Uncharacterized protein n=1 Tax=Portunus trituberculatus TaxID=210409 RepID=A0A5B7CP64_PORTR|nr:hypothetical protein [Portunus trituberculatus]
MLLAERSEPRWLTTLCPAPQIRQQTYHLGSSVELIPCSSNKNPSAVKNCFRSVSQDMSNVRFMRRCCRVVFQ